jgi:glycosyltransferase involved in cell wall biosynthesis
MSHIGNRTPGLRVMQLVDSLSAGGMERVAVNLANGLLGLGWESYLCFSRSGGALETDLWPGVRTVGLGRRSRYDLSAILRLSSHLRSNNISVLHCHSSSIFLGMMASLLAGSTRVVWHDHYGECDSIPRPSWPYRLASTRMQAVLAVNSKLAAWSRANLRVPEGRVFYIPNFVTEDSSEDRAVDLPGQQGLRIVCVANLRPQKDHQNLLQAMRLVLKEVPHAHLLLVGLPGEMSYVDQVRQTMEQDSLKDRVTWLGLRRDVHAILRSCDVGVLSSSSEGLPLSLLEYGMTGLSVVTTDVGQCAEVLDHGNAGVLVPANDSTKLGQALVDLLKDDPRRRELGRRLQDRVRDQYGERQILQRITEIYQTIQA